jgi:hypothetical protein
MWDFSLTKAFGLVFRTWPFIAFRVLVYCGVAAGYVAAVGGGAGLGWILHFLTDPEAGPSYTAWGGLAGFGVASGVLYFAREYILYLVKAGHIAVMVELLDGRSVPDGRAQIGHAQRVVRERFAQASFLFAVDQLVKGVLSAITGMVNFVGTVLPIPGLQQIARFANAVIRLSLTYVDELILAYLIRTQTDNPWAAAQDALVLYAQNYWGFVKNALSITLVMYVLTLLIFAAALGPAIGLAALFPGQFGAWGVVIAAVLAFSFKAAVLEPLAIACLMQVFFKRIEGQSPDPEWHARLSQLSAKFQRMREKALAYTAQPMPGRQA